MGNQLQRSRKIVTVGLYTARKPVVASSRMCSANAAHKANHALPKPDAESADACFTSLPIIRILNHPADTWQSKIGHGRHADGPGHRSQPATANFAHQRQKISFGVAEK